MHTFRKYWLLLKDYSIDNSLLLKYRIMGQKRETYFQHFHKRSVFCPKALYISKSIWNKFVTHWIYKYELFTGKIQHVLHLRYSNNVHLYNWDDVIHCGRLQQLLGWSRVSRSTTVNTFKPQRASHTDLPQLLHGNTNVHYKKSFTKYITVVYLNESFSP